MDPIQNQTNQNADPTEPKPEDSSAPVDQQPSTAPLVSDGTATPAPVQDVVPPASTAAPAPAPAVTSPSTFKGFDTSTDIAPAPAEPVASVSPPVPSGKKKVGKLIAIIVALVVLVAGSAAAYMMLFQKKAAPEATHVKVGVMMAFTGGSSNMGYGALKGIQLAKKTFSADNIEVVQVDSKCDPKSVDEAIKSLIDQKVVAIIGEGCSSASVKALPAANNAKIPMISPSASSPTLSIPNDYFFRVVPPDTFQGEFIAQSIYDKGLKSVAVFYTNEPYGAGMNKVFQEKFEALGGKVVATRSAEPDVITLSTQMKELKAANPQAVFFAPNSVVSGTAAIKLAREAGITAPFFGADIFYDPTIITNAPAATEGLTVTSFPTGNKTFKQALVNEYRVSEQLYAASQAYDAFHAIYMATQKGAKTGEDIKNLLPSIEFEGVSAHIKFDQNGEISNKSYKYDLLQIKGGEFTTL